MTDVEYIKNISLKNLQEDVETMRIKKIHLENILENIKKVNKEPKEKNV